jgi:acyl transferase domain-containing protein
LRHIAASLAQHWQRDAETIAIAAKDLVSLTEQIDAAIAYLDDARTTLPANVSHGSASRERGKLAFLFPGQGSQFTGMLREEALHFPPCAGALAEADRALAGPFAQRYGKGTRLSHFIFPRAAYDDAERSRADEALTNTDIAQPALGAVEVALLRLMRGLGVEPDMVAGHSYGEFVALHAAGAFDFETLMRLSALRGQAIVDAAHAAGSELGTMAAVRGPREEVVRAIADIDDVIVANHNAPSQVVISGSHRGVEEASLALAKAGLAVTPLPVAAAFHSAHVKPARETFAAAINAMSWCAPRIPVYANATGRPHPAKVGALKRAMAEHLVHPVEFVAEVEAMYADGARTFIEVGPKAVLAGLTRRILGDRPHVALALNRGNGLADLVPAFGQLLCAGVELDAAALFKGRECRIADPAKLASLRISQPIPRTAWLLNGGRARRAGEPSRQIGVTLEEAAMLTAERTPPEPAAIARGPIASAGELRAMPEEPDAHPEAPTYPQTARLARPSARPMHIPTNTNNQHSYAQEPGVNDNRPAATLDATVMAEYFDTMRQFLDTQGQVMAALLGESFASRSAAPAARAAPRIAAPRMAEPPLRRASIPLAQERTAPAQLNGSALAAPMAPAAPQPSVAPQASTKAETQERAPVRSNPVAKLAAATDAVMDRSKLTGILLDIVEEKTGYPRDMVGLDQNLEADLGIDSIKRIEVVGAMLQSLPEKQREALTAHRSKLNTQATLNGMLELLASSIDRAAAA